MNTTGWAECLWYGLLSTLADLLLSTAEKKMWNLTWIHSLLDQHCILTLGESVYLGLIDVLWGIKKPQNTYPTRNVIYSEKRIFWLKHAAVLTKLMIFGIKVWKKVWKMRSNNFAHMFPSLPPTLNTKLHLINVQQQSEVFNVNEQCVDVREMYWVRMYKINNNTCVGMPVYCVCVCVCVFGVFKRRKLMKRYQQLMT